MGTRIGGGFSSERGRGPGRGDGGGPLPVPGGQVVPAGRGGPSRLPNLPSAFRGTTVALVSDVHHGPFVPLAYVRHIVETTNCAQARPRAPDRRLRLQQPPLHRAGDRGAGQAEGRARPVLRCWATTTTGRARRSRGQALDEAGITRTDNTGVWVERGGARLRICGVGDLWTDRQYLRPALGDATDRDAVILLSHNPDFAETLRDPPRRPDPERPYPRRPGRRPRLRRPDRPLALRPEVPPRPGPGPALPGLRQPRRRHRQPRRSASSAGRRSC